MKSRTLQKRSQKDELVDDLVPRSRVLLNHPLQMPAQSCALLVKVASGTFDFSLLRKSQLVKIVPALFNFALYLTALELELVRKGISLSFKSLKVFPDRRNPCSDVSGQSGCLLANVLLSSESNRLLDLFVDHARRNQSA